MRTEDSNPRELLNAWLQWKSNHRPVSLTCITCKIMEHLVCSQIGRHRDHNNILHANQHGFRKGLSCETQFLDTIHELAYSINQKTQTHVIFMDAIPTVVLRTLYYTAE